MPWNKDDNGNGGNGGGPWGNNGGNNGGNQGPTQGPWGNNNRNQQRPNWGKGGGGGPGGAGGPPDLEEILQKAKNWMPGGGGGVASGGRFPWLIPVVLGVLFVAYNSVYQVQPDERGVVLRLGEYSRTVDPGLQFALWPVERIEKPKTGTVRQFAVGNDPSDGQMLTNDKNIITVPFTVQWRIANAKDFLFNVADQERTIRALAQSAMREVVAQNSAQAVLTTKKSEIAAKALTITQGLLDEYQSGVTLTALNLGETAPPPEVADAFADVVRAEQDRKRNENEAQQVRNQRNQQAQGEVGRLVEEATAYKAAAIAEALGESARFTSVYEQYKNAKDVTRQRIFIETMEQVLRDTNKVIIEGGQNGSGVVPYLPLPQIQKPAN